MDAEPQGTQLCNTREAGCRAQVGHWKRLRPRPVDLFSKARAESKNTDRKATESLTPHIAII